VLINADQRGWIVGTTAVGVLATAGYLAYVRASPYGPSGGSWPGLTFGIAGTAAMLAAGLLTARKKVVLWRVGTARSWMKMHIWLGLLAVPLIWFHSGFRLGGALTTTVMILFYVVVVSGIVGLVIQQVVPTAMTSRVPLETLWSQIEHVGAGLAVDAYELVASVAGSIPEAAEEVAELAREEQAQQTNAANWKQIARTPASTTPAADAIALREFYLAEVRPYLRRRRGVTLAPPNFDPLRVRAPEAWADTLDRLRALCDESRQLALQQRLHVWLHGWLFVHAPLSFALFVLVAIHIVYALRY
jgi:hypothetical protein